MQTHNQIHYIGPADPSRIRPTKRERPVIRPQLRTHRNVLGALAVLPNFVLLTAIITQSHVLGFVTLLSIFLVLGSYGTLALRNQHLDEWAKKMWLASFIVAGPIAVPLYWLSNIVHRPSAHQLEA